MVRPEQGRELFYNKRVLEQGYVPSTVPGREEQKKFLRTSIRPLLEGKAPPITIIYGDSGTGKTLVTKKVVDQLQTEADRRDSPDFDLHWINCCTSNTDYQIAVAICNKLRPTEDWIPPDSGNRDIIFKTLQEEVRSQAKPCLIIIDEFETVEAPGTLFPIFAHTDPPIGWLLITQDPTPIRESDALTDTPEIEFPRYSKSDLAAIFESRSKKAFREDALGYGVVEYITAACLNSAAPVSRGLEILRMAGEVATSAGNRKIRTAEVTEAVQRVDHDEIAIKIADLTDQERVVLSAILSAEEPRREIIYGEYEILCAAAGIPALSKRSVHNYLQGLCEENVISSTENRTGSRGNYHTYEIFLDEKLVRELLVPDVLDV